jgi:hypothetical protein
MTIELLGSTLQFLRERKVHSIAWIVKIMVKTLFYELSMTIERISALFSVVQALHPEIE